MNKTITADGVDLPNRAALTGGVATDDWVILSGQLAYDASVDGIPEGMDIADQTRAVMENIGALLRSEGCDFGDIVRVTIYLTDFADLPGMNAVYSSYVTEPYPARTTLGVPFLAMPGAKVEIEAMAHRRKG
jgi:2-iminobutanoate/2-iminopropanoate deaminase